MFLIHVVALAEQQNCSMTQQTRSRWSQQSHQMHREGQERGGRRAEEPPGQLPSGERGGAGLQPTSAGRATLRAPAQRPRWQQNRSLQQP